MNEENKYWKKYFLRPLLSGMVGFISVFLIISIIKLVDIHLQRSASFSLQEEDFFYCGISFFVVGTLEVLKNFKHRQIL